MCSTVLLTLVFHAAVVAGSNYSVTDLKEEVSETWQLSHFSDMIRQAVVSAVPFPWETVEQVLDSEEQVDSIELAQQMITHELPLLVPAGLGLLLAILVPIITLFFCCCRCCCGWCGGKLSVQSVQKHNMISMVINAFIVVVMVGILSAMACCIPLSGDRMKSSPRLIYRTLNASLDDIPNFLEKFVEDAADLSLGVLNTTVDNIKDELDDLPDALSDPVVEGARPYVDLIEGKIDVVSNNIDSLKVAETQIVELVDAMIIHSDNLQTGLTTINNRYTAIKQECVDAGKTFCDSLPDGTGPDAMDVSIDNSKLTDLATEVTNLVAEADNVDLDEYKTLGNKTFEEVPKTVRNASQGAINSVKDSLDTVYDEVKPQIDKALESAKFDMDLSHVIDPLDDGIKQFENNDQTIGAVLKLLGCILFAIGMTALVGLLLGVFCTKKPTSSQTGRTKTGQCGACLLMTSVGLAVFPLLLILLFGSILMLLGGNFTIICAPLQDLTVFKRLVDNGLLLGGESLGEKFFNDSSLNMTVTNLFKTCRDDGTVYTGLNMDSVLDLSSIFDPDEFVPDLGDSVVNQVNDTIKDISIVDITLFDELKSKLELPDMDTSTAQDIEDELNGIDIEGKAVEINDLADTLPDPDFKDKYKAIGTGLQELHTNSKVPLLKSLDNLTTVIDGLNSTSQDMKVIITDLSQDLNELTSFIETKAVDIIVETLEAFLDQMKAVPDELIDTVLNALRTDIGRCKVLADVYDIVIASICNHFLDSFNVLWASFYTGGMVCVILMISSCTMSKYFRRPDDVYTQQRQRQNASNNACPSPSAVNVDLICYKSLAEGDTNNNTTFPNTNYQRLHHKWRKRRQFITDPFSAQFFNGNIEENSLWKEKSFIRSTSQEKDDKRPICTVVELDSSTSQIACCSQELSSFDGNSSNESLETVDEISKTKLMETSETDRVNTVESQVTSSNEINDHVRSSIEYTKPVCNSKDDENCLTEITAFPYLQLVGDEFILIPMTHLKSESLELNEDSSRMNQENDDGHQSKTKPDEEDQAIYINDRHICSDQWLTSYKLESIPGSSPLVKYNSENEHNPSTDNQTDKNGQNTVPELPYSNLGYMDSDHASDVSLNLDDGLTELNTDVLKAASDSLKSFLRPGKYLIKYANRETDTEVEYPVKDVTCALCKKDKSMEQFVLPPNFKNQPRDNQTKMSFNNIDSENVNRHSGFESGHSECCLDMKEFSKSLENSFQAFDDTYKSIALGKESNVIDSVHQPEQKIGSNKTKKNKTESKSKLHIEVQPYKPMEKLRSPESAFVFWKTLEDNHNSPSDCNNYHLEKEGEQEKGRGTKRNFKPEIATMQPLHKLASKELFQCHKVKPGNEISGNENIKDISSCSEPAPLVNLAITAGRRAYVRDESNVKVGSKDDDRQPQSLAKLSMDVSSGLSNIQQKRGCRCELATTRKDNVQVSYI